ncbi:MAG: PP2C family protein-serine/threonine phosphatase [Candidatus Acidiferrales bacterium]
MTADTQVLDVSWDWMTACDVQERFMHQAGPAIATLSYSARCRQMRALGGDFYDFMPLSHDRLALAIGDASGKGLAAALMISNVQSSLRTAATFVGDDGPALLTAVNRQVHVASLADRYATLFYGVFDGATRTLEYVNAGHNPPIVIRREGSIFPLAAAGVPLGIFPDSTYMQETILLDPGDVILAYTDGVVEARNPAGEEWGIEGLGKSVRQTVGESIAQSAEEIVREVFTSVDDFSQGQQTDDATVAVVRVHRIGE